MSHTATTTCPGCGADYLVSYETEGEAEPARHSVHCFECETCRARINAPVPANANVDSVTVSRGRSSN